MVCLEKLRETFNVNHEKILFTKKFLNELFEKDFNNALLQYNKIFRHKNHSIKEKELLIEMTYQLGPRGVLGFKKMIYHIDKRNKYMACLEMMQSLWYKQTPQRTKLTLSLLYSFCACRLGVWFYVATNIRF